MSYIRCLLNYSIIYVKICHNSYMKELILIALCRWSLISERGRGRRELNVSGRRCRCVKSRVYVVVVVIETKIGEILLTRLLLLLLFSR